ncbi:leucine-rich repeat domain-containing protein [Ruminococcus sp.]|uniref:leucine-rich repeat domain-containing protein n=1 Tax=Ruminococcus sp. TaxID=41978 RepID=UPI002E75E2F2|nr:leucine-rich repeat domain-containing protein [Ruminococcus sp.]MEE1261481.1 leucine-rich repeat domain-containing protein [Ruminococcus sp.]
MAIRVIPDDTVLQNAAVAIQSKDHGGKMGVDEMAGRIYALPSLPLEEKDVNFYDYDGTVLYAFSKQEALNLEALPALPIREGLIAQEWNWDLADIKDYVTEYGACDIGANYTTNDGATRLYLHIENENELVLTLNAVILTSGTLTVEHENVVLASSSQTGLNALSFTIPTPTAFPYDTFISVKISGNGTYRFGDNDMSYTVLADKQYLLTKVETGDNLEQLSHYSFYRTANLKSISISSNIKNYLGVYAFSQSGLKHFNFSKRITQTADYAFQNSFNLKSISAAKETNLIGINSLVNTGIVKLVVPKKVSSTSGCIFLKKIILSSSQTTIGLQAFNGTTSLVELILPNSVTSIGNKAFQGSAIRVLDLTAYTDPTAIPTLGSSVFYNVPSGLIILVKNQEMYDAFISATNWSAYASSFQIKPSGVI